MKLVIIGNIGSGKTTILKKLNKYFQYEEVIIDNYRIDFGNGDIDGEFLARDNFFLTIKEGKNQFIECTGVGEVATRLFKQINKYEEDFYLLKLITSKESCANRIRNRNWNIPFPFKKEPLFSKLTRIEMELSSKINCQKKLLRNDVKIYQKKNEVIEDVNSIVKEMILEIQKFSKHDR